MAASTLSDTSSAPRCGAITSGTTWAGGLIPKLTRYPAAPLLTGLVLALSVWKLPFVPDGFEPDLSLSGVLSFAHEHHLQFGPQIISTYGPLGWLYFPFYASHSGILQLYAQLALSVAALTGCCLAAWRMGNICRWLFLGLFTWAAVNSFYRADLLVQVGLLGWGLLCWVEEKRRLLACLSAFIVFAALASLVKISFFIIGGASVTCVALDLMLRKKPGHAAGLVGGFVLVFAAGWVASGQSLLNLGTFLVHGIATVRSYHEALGIQGLAALRTTAFVLSILLSILILFRSAGAFESGLPHRRFRRVLLFMWLSLLAFASWKHGFTRLDRYHAPLFLDFALAMALVTEVVSCAGPWRAKAWTCGTAMLCALVAAHSAQTFFFSSLGSSLLEPFRALGSHVRVLFHPLGFSAGLERFRSGIREDQQLPTLQKIIGKESVDVFGQYQAFALDNDLNYEPRPVFQSYNACNRRLMAFNERHYLSGRQPRFLLFELGALDNKFAPLEDAWLLRHLLINYQPVAQEKRFVLLEAKSNQPCQLTLVEEGHVGLGQKIDLARYGGTPLWLEIEIAPSVKGRMRQLLYAPPAIRLAAWKESRLKDISTTEAAHRNGKELIARRRAPPAMLAAGFVANPLLLRTQDLPDLFSGKEIARPAAYSVEPDPGQEELWQTEVRFRVYKIENPVGWMR